MKQQAEYFAQQDFVSTPGYTLLSSQLGKSGKTLYELEQDIVNQVEAGKIWWMQHTIFDKPI